MQTVVTNPLVSIVTPAYNSAQYIEATVESVLEQGFNDWEMIIVDDCSSDNTWNILKNLKKKDSRIKVFQLERNSGASAARNKALEISNGRFIAYLDADDIWFPYKLEKQVQFMLKNKYGFSCASYEVIDETGQKKNKKVHMLPVTDYRGFLTNNLLQTVGIMVDTNIVDKTTLVMPNLRRRQDAATWLQVLKSGNNCYGYYEILAQYRRVEGSLSSNKFKAVRGVWFLYRKVEKLSLSFSCYCFVRYAFLAVWKRMYISKKKNGD